jgi:hypothetical protein
VRRLMQQAGVTRRRRTARQRAVAERGRQVQSVSWQARRAARLAELGFVDLAGYLQARYVEQGWPIKRLRAELGVSRKLAGWGDVPAGVAVMAATLLGRRPGWTPAARTRGPRQRPGRRGVSGPAEPAARGTVGTSGAR